MLEFDADPHNCTPSVQIGFRIALHTSSLFSSDNCDLLPMIQYSLCSLGSSCFLFVYMCLRQVSFRSRCTYTQIFTSSRWVSCLLFSWTGGPVFFFKVKVNWTDFVSFTFIRHLFNHSWILFKLRSL